MLVVENMTIYNHANLPILTDLCFTVSPGTLLVVSGINGSGKTELAMALSGHGKCSATRATYKNKNLLALTPHQIAHLGLAFVPEERLLFEALTVQEHLELGMMVAGLFPKRSVIQTALDRIFNIFPKLYDRKKQIATTLSGGEQQMLCIGRALMNNPTCLILDEPTQGLSIPVAQNFLKTILDLKNTGLSIVLIEQGIQRSIEQDKIDQIIHLENGKGLHISPQRNGK
ncbi:MAG: High-affinity branched-chain amino acid transport ATP-binding protein LivF [Holosporales bacterium]